MDQKQLGILLDKYLAGTCTPEEEQVVQHWLSSRNTNESEWHNMTPAAQQAYLDALYKDVRQSIKVVPITSRRRLFLRIAAIAVIVLGAGLLYILMRQQSTPAMTLECVAGVQEATLPDGSVVALNAGSKLEYLVKGDTREVTLEGEAFFVVKADPNQPFVITSGKVRTRVLGTSFNIQAYPKDDHISVSVVSGKVEMSKAAEKIVLEKGEKGLYNKQQGNLSQAVFSDPPSAWVNGELNFFHMPLAEVAKVLERSYQVTIDISNNSSKQCEITGKFRINQSIDEVLQLICKTIDATYEVEGSRIRIQAGKGCQH